MFGDFGVNPTAPPLTLPASCADLGGIPDRRELLNDAVNTIPACLDPTCEQAGGQPPGDTIGCMNSNPQNGFVENNSVENWGYKHCCLAGIRANFPKCSEALAPPCECDVGSVECISAPAAIR